ncbi:MAG: hypothetical protein LBS68_00245, partial [Puniceicoccales bacterium]|nr:hypothetical protein [Puniceicoccales bacterium]
GAGGGLRVASNFFRWVCPSRGRRRIFRWGHIPPPPPPQGASVKTFLPRAPNFLGKHANRQHFFTIRQPEEAFRPNSTEV